MIVAEKDANQYQCCNMLQRCKGVNCMAWVWVMETDPKTMTPPDMFIPITRSTTHGYCGLIRELC